MVDIEITPPPQIIVDAGNLTEAMDQALQGKASTIHTHPISSVTGLQAALDGKNTMIDGAMTAHLQAADPHPNYTTAVELVAALATMATPADVSAAVTAHEQAVDPHPGYTSAADLATAIAQTQPLINAGNAASVRSAIGCNLRLLFASPIPETITGTTAETAFTQAQFTIPANTFAAGSILWLLANVSATANTNSKQFFFKLNGTTILSQTRADTNPGQETHRMCRIQSNGQQLLVPSSATGNSPNQNRFNINFTVNQAFTMTALLANSADSITLESVALIGIGV